MNPSTRTAFLALGTGLATAAVAVVMILRVTNDMRWLLLLGAACLFLAGRWLGAHRGGGVPSFLLLCAPLLLLVGLAAIPELPGLWPHLPLWLVFALLGWFGFRSPGRAAVLAAAGLLLTSLIASWYALAYVPGEISRTLNRSREDPAPDFVLETLAGTSFPMTSLAGKVVVLDFFATWCAPCIAELPEIDAIYRRFADHPDVEVLVVANLSGGDTRERIRDFAAQRQLDVPFVFDPGATAHRAFGFAGLPGLVVIDRADRVRFSREGYNAAETGFQETVVGLVEELATGPS